MPETSRDRARFGFKASGAQPHAGVDLWVSGDENLFYFTVALIWRSQNPLTRRLPELRLPVFCHTEHHAMAV